MIDKIKEAKAEDTDKPTDKLKNLLMFFIGVGIIAFVMPEIIVATDPCINSLENIGESMPSTTIFDGSDADTTTDAQGCPTPTSGDKTK